MKSRKKSSSNLGLGLVLAIVAGMGVVLGGKIFPKLGVAFGSVQSTGTINVIASADTFVREDAPSAASNFKYMNIQTGTNARRWGIVRFVVSGLETEAAVTSAYVNLYVSNGSVKNGSTTSAGYLCRATTNTGAWTESTLTWNSTVKPDFDCTSTFNLDIPGSPGATTGTTKTSADLSSVVTGNGTYEFYIMTNAADNVSYATKEGDAGSAGTGYNAANYPTLVVNWETGTGSVTPTPTVALPTPTPGESSPSVNVTHGPIVGGVTSASARVFMRAGVLAQVQVQYSTDPNFLSDVTTSPAQTTLADDDYTTIFNITGLTPDTQYYYRFVNHTTPKVYQFKTFPLDSAAAPFKFAVFADLAVNSTNPAPAYATAATFDPAFVMQIGDFDHQNPGKNSPRTASKWWAVAKKAIWDYQQGKDIANNLLNKYPFVHIWDDHDYGDNNWDYSSGGNTANKYTAAMPAFKDYYPTYDLGNQTEGLWHKFKYGNLAEFFVLDLKSQKSPNNATDNVSKSMLNHQSISNDQKSWLKNGLANSTATWKFVVSSSVWNRKSKRDDSWYLYKTEQQELVTWMVQNNIKNVIVMDADMHSAGGIDNGSGLSELGACLTGTETYCIPELAVPHTNMVQLGCTGSYGTGPCGIYNCNAVSGANCIIDPGSSTLTGHSGGFGLVEVQPDAVVLKAMDQNGSVRVLPGTGDPVQFTVNVK